MLDNTREAIYMKHWKEKDSNKLRLHDVNVCDCDAVAVSR
jgi:hypothetical protein